MNHFLRSFAYLTITFLFISIPGTAATLGGTPVISDVPTTYLSQFGCQAPDPHSGPFLTTDARVALYSEVDGGLVGDVYEVRWYQPDGVVYGVSEFDPLSEAGGFCFLNTIDIAGQEAENLPGEWTVEGHWNGVRLYSLNFTIQAAGGGSSEMRINAVLNAASGVPASLEGGGIARGSFFSVYGLDIGPVDPVGVVSFPFEETLGGVSLEIQQNGQSYPCYPHYVSQYQVNGIMHSNAPLGNGTLVLTYQGRSVSFAVRVVAHSFGAFAISGGRGQGIIQSWLSPTNQPLNSVQNPLVPGSGLGIIWGTGLGGTAEGDNLPPAGGNLPYDVKVYLGGKVANHTYAGRAPGFPAVDVIYFDVAADATTGCNVPLQVEVEGSFSNVVTAVVGPVGQVCQNPIDIVDDFIGDGSRFGALVLARANLLLQLESGQPPLDLGLDVGLAAFGDLQVQGGLGSLVQGIQQLQGISLPPTGSCQAYSGNLNLENLLSGVNLDDLGSLDDDLGEGIQTRGLDAGLVLNLDGPPGNRQLMLADSETPGLYVGLLGGGIPLDDTPPPPLYLTRGAHTLRGTGGVDIPAFNTTFNVPDLPTWSNRGVLSTINRSTGFTMEWTGGDASQVVLIGGVSTNQATQATGGFFCVANATDRSFRIRPGDLANMPVTPAVANLEESGAVVGMIAVPAESLETLQIPTLDAALAITTAVDIRTVAVQ